MSSARLAFAVVVVLACLAAGCPDTTPASDARGNYDLAFDDKITIKLSVGGAEQTQEATESDVVTFQVNGAPVELDLGAFCAKEEVKCPSETLWTKVSIDQPNINAQLPNTHVVNVVDNRVHELPPGQSAETIGGLVDQNDNLTLLVGGDSRGDANGDCGLLALSVATGRFQHEGETTVDEPVAGVGPDGGVVDGGTVERLQIPPGSKVVGVAGGALKIGFLGVCAFGPAVVGATLELGTGYTGTRTGDFDPPPFTPVDPATVPAADAGPVDAGDVVDAG